MNGRGKSSWIIQQNRSKFWVIEDRAPFNSNRREIC